MSDDQVSGGNPISEGAGDVAQKSMAIALLLGQAIKEANRVKQEKLALETAKTTEQRLQHQAKLKEAWEQNRQDWKRTHPQGDEPTVPLYVTRGGQRGEDPTIPLPTVEAGRLLASGMAFADTDPDARRATDIAERRLGALQPDLMADYYEQRSKGVERLEAFTYALAHNPNLQENPEATRLAVMPDPTFQAAAEAARTIGQDEHQEAVTMSSRQDLPQTVVDERAEGLESGSNHQELSDASIARAANLHSQVQPYPMTTRLAATASGPARSLPGRVANIQRPTRGRGR
jgi:hypothetical protein